VNAAKKLEQPYEVDEATRNVAGSPSIFETILGKIERSALFVGDLTIVTGGLVRPSCNANVLLEYGFALAKLGEKRLIPILNRNYGSPEELPFDLRHKAIRLIYDLAPGAIREDIRSVQRALEGRLRSELHLVLGDPGSVFKLSRNEVMVAEYISNGSKRGMSEEEYSMDDLSAALKMDGKEAKQAVAEMVSRGYLRRLESIGTDSPSVRSASRLFWDFDPYFKVWNSQEDARAMAKKLVETSDSGYGSLATREFADQEGWPLRRLNPALQYLVQGAIVEFSKVAMSDVVTIQIYETEATRSFLRGDYNPYALRRDGMR
jgi:hypothetical protein